MVVSKILVSCYTCYAKGLTNLHGFDVHQDKDAVDLAMWLVKHNGHTILAKEEK